jgi:hypothetical protein
MLSTGAGSLANGQARGGSMSKDEDAEQCHFCKRGYFRERPEEIAFHQWTNKGYVLCRVTVTLAVCDHCGSRNWSEDIEALLDEAVRQGYDKLP